MPITALMNEADAPLVPLHRAIRLQQSLIVRLLATEAATGVDASDLIGCALVYMFDSMDAAVEDPRAAEPTLIMN